MQLNSKRYIAHVNEPWYCTQWRSIQRKIVSRARSWTVRRYPDINIILDRVLHWEVAARFGIPLCMMLWYQWFIREILGNHSDFKQEWAGIKPLPAMLASYICPGLLSSTSLPNQLPAKLSGKGVEDGPSDWSCEIGGERQGEIWVTFLAHSFYWL